MKNPFSITYTRKLSETITPENSNEILLLIQKRFFREYIPECRITNGMLVFKRKFFSGFLRGSEFALVDSGNVQFDMNSHTLTFQFSLKRMVLSQIFAIIFFISLQQWSYGLLFVAVISLFTIAAGLAHISKFAGDTTNEVNELVKRQAVLQ